MAIGVAYEDIGSVADAGAVNVLYGYTSGLSAGGNQLWSQDSDGVDCCAPEKLDRFGYTLAAGDLNADNRDDLAVGVRYESVVKIDNAGGVSVFYGSKSGLSAAGNQFWHQDVDGVLGTAEDGDRFGYSLAVLGRSTPRYKVFLPAIFGG